MATIGIRDADCMPKLVQQDCLSFPVEGLPPLILIVLVSDEYTSSRRSSATDMSIVTKQQVYPAEIVRAVVVMVEVQVSGPLETSWRVI